MGKVMSVAIRKAKRFNVENRAHSFLDKTKDKPIAAPKYEANIRDLDRVLKSHPEVADTLNRKNTELDDRLKKVYVTSSDHIIAAPIGERTKSLPQDRATVPDFEYGHMEPEKVSRGRTTLRQALEFITKHQTEPQTWTAERIAADYKLNATSVANILKYFHTFEVFIPSKDSKKDNILLQESFRGRLTEVEKPSKAKRLEGVAISSLATFSKPPEPPTK